MAASHRSKSSNRFAFLIPDISALVPANSMGDN
jgi:hypothetical protein